MMWSHTYIGERNLQFYLLYIQKKSKNNIALIVMQFKKHFRKKLC